MAKNNKPKTSAEAKAISSLEDFKGRRRGVFELPSGLVVKMKNPGGLQAFIANGTIPNSLLGIVQESLKGAKINATEQARAMAKDMDSLAEMMQLLDIVASQTIIEPPVRKTPTDDDVTRYNLMNPQATVTSPEDLRDDEKYLYTDDIDELDKQFIMQWVTGGTRDLETFRAEYEASVAAVQAVEGPGGDAELTAGAEEG